MACKSTEAYTPMFTALCWATVRRIPESLGRSSGRARQPGRPAGSSNPRSGVRAGPVMLASPLAWWWPSAWWRLAPFCPHAERRIITSEG